MGNIEGLPNSVNCTCKEEINSTLMNNVITRITFPSRYSTLEGTVFEMNGPRENCSSTSSYVSSSVMTRALTEENLFARNQNSPSPDFKFMSQVFTVISNLMLSSDPVITSDVQGHKPFGTTISTTAETCTCPLKRDPWKIHRLISSIASVIVSSIIILANLFVIGSIIWSLWHYYKRSTISRSNRSYIFMFNLALADFIVGLSSVVSFCLNQTQLNSNIFSICLIEICFIITPCCASIVTMTIVGVDRYLAVMHPFKYKSIITKQKAVLVIVLAWVVSFLIGFAPLMGWNAAEDYEESEKICSYLFVVQPSYAIFVLFGGFFPQLLLISYLYVQIFRVSKKHSMKISQTQPLSQTRFHQLRKESDCCDTIVQDNFVTSNYSRSCPVSPVMPKIEINEEYCTGNRVSTVLPNRRKPFRTVSFGPAAFEEQMPENRFAALSSTTGELLHPEVRNDSQDDNLFEQFLSLPGTVYCQKELPEVVHVEVDVLNSLNNHKTNKNSNFHKMKRTVSYAGTSLASQLSSRFGTLRKEAVKRNIKALRTVALLIGFFFFMWSPFLFLSVIQMICGSNCSLENLVGTYLLLLGIANSAINPLVYTYTNRELKKQMSRLCRKKTKRSIVTNHDPFMSETLPNISVMYSNDLNECSIAQPRSRRITANSIQSNGVLGRKTSLNSRFY